MHLVSQGGKVKQARPASDEPLADQVRGFCEDLERNGGSEDWQVRQARDRYHLLLRQRFA